MHVLHTSIYRKSQSFLLFKVGLDLVMLLMIYRKLITGAVLTQIKLRYMHAHHREIVCVFLGTAYPRYVKKGTRLTVKPLQMTIRGM
jgi:hypothetical protein